jgi:hypothetical protein
VCARTTPHRTFFSFVFLLLFIFVISLSLEAELLHKPGAVPSPLLQAKHTLLAAAMCLAKLGHEASCSTSRKG